MRETDRSYYQGHQGNLPRNWKFPERKSSGLVVLGLHESELYLAAGVDYSKPGVMAEEATDLDSYNQVEYLFGLNGTPLIERYIGLTPNDSDVIFHQGEVRTNYLVSSDGIIIDFAGLNQKKRPSGLGNFCYDYEGALEYAIFEEAFRERSKGRNIISPRVWVRQNTTLDHDTQREVATEGYHFDLDTKDREGFRIRTLELTPTREIAVVTRRGGRTRFTFRLDLEEKPLYIPGNPEPEVKNVLVASQTNDRSGEVKVLEGPLIQDLEGLMKIVKAPTTLADNQKLNMPWLGIREYSQVRLSYANQQH